MNVVVLCLDKVGPRMAGIAIRSVEIARRLAPHADVVLAAARTVSRRWSRSSSADSTSSRSCG